MKTYTHKSLKEFNTFHIEAKTDNLTIFETEQEAKEFFKENHIETCIITNI